MARIMMSKFLWLMLSISLSCIIMLTSEGKSKNNKDYLKWKDIAQLPPMLGQEESLGVAGPFVGVHNDALIVAGGANFPKPFLESDKVWHDDIWVLIKKINSYEWIYGGKLDHPLAYGASVSTDEGVVCIGGNDLNCCYAEVFILRWDANSQKR